MRLQDLTFDQCVRIARAHCEVDWYLFDGKERKEIRESLEHDIKEWRKTDESETDRTTMIWEYLYEVEEFARCEGKFDCLICEYGHLLKEDT